MAGPVRFSFWKFLLCVAAYAAMFAWNRELGWLGFPIAIVSGTALSILFIAARWTDVPAIAMVIVAALIGGVCLVLPTVDSDDRYLLARTIQGVAVGAMVGMVINAIVRMRRQKNSTQSNQESAN